MKTGIHPDYVEATISCSCGATFQTHSTKESMKLEVCSECHPFYSGVQKIVDTAGRVQKFQNKYGDNFRKKAEAPAEGAEAAAAAAEGDDASAAESGEKS